MINKVTNIEELRAEKVRLQVKKEVLEQAIKDDFRNIKESLNPLSFLKTKVNGVGSSENGTVNKLMGTGLSFALDFLIRRILLRKSGFIKKTLVSSVIYSLGSKILTDKSGVIISKIKEFIERMKSDPDKNGHSYDRTTASEDYEQTS